MLLTDHFSNGLAPPLKQFAYASFSTHKLLFALK